MEEGRITIREASARYGLSRDTLYRWNKEGRLPFYKELGLRETLVRIDELEAALQSRPGRGRPRKEKAARD
jgi:excisionase family DNA binding protein